MNEINFPTAATPSAGPEGIGLSEPGQGLDSFQALERLKAGNQRFLENRCLNPDRAPSARPLFLDSQYPYAMILGCADSRVPPELLFDEGLGDLFIVRHVGNTADWTALAAVEYAVRHLGVPLVVVLGHEVCGAIQAAASHTHSGEPEENLGSVLALLQPAVEKGRAQPGDPLENAMRCNIAMQAEAIRSMGGSVGEALQAGRVRVVGACYRIETGQVEWLDN